MNIKIDKSIIAKTPNFRVGVLSFNVNVYKEDKINQIISSIEKEISSTINIKDVVNLDIIKDARDAYKLYGKDPSRYRLAVESLYRRISKGNKLYRINNVVDLGNILSLKTRRSIAVLDLDKIKGDILIRLGTESDEFYGIGRGKINIQNIPLYEDDLSPFGSSTSDTERTMITSNTKQVLLFIISFNGIHNLEEDLEYAKDLYSNYARGVNFIKNII